MPFTGASAKRTVLLMRDANTRSPKFSSRISIASWACSVRVSTIVGRMPSMSTSGLRFSRIIVQRVLQLDQAAHRQILALHGDDHLVGRRQRVDRQQSQGRRRVDADEVVVVRNGPQRLVQRALAADLHRHRDLGAGEVDRGAGDVDLARADHLADRQVVHEHVVHRRLDGVRVDALRHRQVALRVHVDAEHAVALLGEGRGEVQRGGGLRDAALLVGEGDDLGSLLRGRLHVSSPVRSGDAGQPAPAPGRVSIRTGAQTPSPV